MMPSLWRACTANTGLGSWARTILTPAITRRVEPGGRRVDCADRALVTSKLLPLGRALDRVLTRNYYMLPMWYMAQTGQLYWVVFFRNSRSTYILRL